ncbi:MAG: copper transporter [Ignavibacteriales bacterium]
MIDIRYHIATLVAVFLALAVGILIGSTFIDSDMLVDQQKKMISQLESQFTELRQRESELTSENRFTNQVAQYYEQYSQTVSIPVIKNRLAGNSVAIIVTGGQEMPKGFVNSLSLAGANVTSTTVFLSAMTLDDENLSVKVCDFYGADKGTPPDELRKMIALNVSTIISKGEDAEAREFLQKNNLVTFSGAFTSDIKTVVLIGGSEDVNMYFPTSVDAWLVRGLQTNSKTVVGCETSRVKYSYMPQYQQFDISTIDDIDITPGQVALIRSLEGEIGDYGVKKTAKKFMPSLPAEFLQGVAK